MLSSRKISSFKAFNTNSSLIFKHILVIAASFFLLSRLKFHVSNFFAHSAPARHETGMHHDSAAKQHCECSTAHPLSLLTILLFPRAKLSYFISRRMLKSHRKKRNTLAAHRASAAAAAVSSQWEWKSRKRTWHFCRVSSLLSSTSLSLSCKKKRTAAAAANSGSE